MLFRLDYGLVAVAFNHDRGGDAHHALVLLAFFLFEFFDDDCGGVGQLVAREAEQLFAHDFACEEFFAAVGQIVRIVPPGLLWQVGRADIQQAGDLLRKKRFSLLLP